ncbi:ATP-binding protein [Pararhodospirillum photometricum]|uniref:Stage II sporulation E n=1 Tax=Pararhodospirillum photometricum DSM 122 TaxID=1150469 RepID=H6SNB9_PARPM|nr:ATP-binding protein [Pararhodospirillum photometricum]CCG06995.1 Stage II sporulation E [Pararhodospirillum photometricum DSM 122]
MSSARFPAVLDSLAPVRDLVKQSAVAAGLSSAQAYRLMLAVDEVATNIIVHGYQENGLSGVLDLTLTLEDGDIIVTLEDDAVPFDPASLDPPLDEDLAQPLDDREEGGLGIMLAMDGVDRFAYERTEGRNRNRFAVRIREG